MHKLLIAQHDNWGRRCEGEWRYTRFKLSDNGELKITVDYDRPVSDTTEHITYEDLLKVRKIIETLIKEPPADKTDACDGSAWSFIVYDDQKNIIYEREMGYTYAIKPLEKLQRILNHYIPKYEIPDPEKNSDIM